MPTYEYECDKCKKHFDIFQGMKDNLIRKCPECGGIWMDKDQLEKVEGVVDGWKKCLHQDLKKYGSILKKVELEERQNLDKTVSISGFSFVNAILRRFCE